MLAPNLDSTCHEISLFFFLSLISGPMVGLHKVEP